MELVTKAGTVVLPRTHIDVLQGPESSNLLYLGQVEERRLRLKTFAEQLEEVARRGNGAREGGKVTIPPREREAAGRNWARGENAKRAKEDGDHDSVNKLKEVWNEGSCFVGSRGWNSLTYVNYVVEPLAEDCYITTAALPGDEEDLNDKEPPGGVLILDLESNVQRWLGLSGPKGRYVKRVTTTLRVLPDENKDVATRLTMLSNVVFRVVQSDKPAVVIGKRQFAELQERRDEGLTTAGSGEVDYAAIEHRLNEMFDAAKLEGMSKEGLAEARGIMKEKFRNVWRMKLRPGDVADLPAFKIELKGDGPFVLPRPYRRRYTPVETQWWFNRMDELCRVGVMRRSGSGQLSPSNLLPKKREGVIITDDFRMVVDMRHVNSRTKPIYYGLPKLDTVIHHLAGSDCFGKGDKVNGYWQVNLDEESRPLTAFDCPAGAFEHCRMPQGHCNAVQWFQKCFEGVLRPMLWRKVLQYLDDSLLHAKGERKYLDNLAEYFALLDKHNVKLHPAKFTLFARRLTWCGKEVSKNGTRPAPHRTEAVKSMPDPNTLAELMNFVYGTAWFRGNMIHFAKTAAPLYDLWKNALEPYKRKTMQVAKKFILKNLPGWKKKGKEAFEALKKALVNAIETAFFDPELKTCVYGDASEEFWCLVITQCEPGVERRPWNEQEGCHRVLVIASGRFRNAQLRWAIVDKEGYVYGEKLHDYAHWVNGGRYASALFTDHHNLLCFYDDKVRPSTCTKPNRQRLTRWGLNLRSLWYEIHPIPGEENRVADLGSRWANRFAKAEGIGGCATGGPKVMTKAWLGRPCACSAASKKVLRLPAPELHGKASGADINADAKLMVDEKTPRLNLLYVREQQDKYRKSRPKGLKVGAGKVWRAPNGKIWVPTRARMLKNAVYAMAHQGVNEHRGKEATLAEITPFFEWKQVEKEVETRRAMCLICIKLANGDIIPRPRGTQLIPERANEVHMMDYIVIWPSETGRKYVLMQADKLSKLTEFTPTFDPTAVPACQGLLRWSSRYGLPSWLISDGGPHFANDALELLTGKLEVEHHITLSYCPWANGSIEVVGKALLRCLRGLLIKSFRPHLG